MSNPTRHGFRWIRGEGQSKGPNVIKGIVASGYGTVLHEGTPVKKVDTGHYERAAAGDLIFGVIASIYQYYDSNLGRLTKPLNEHPKKVPASTTYTGIDNETRIGIIPCQGNYFEADMDAALSTATRAGALALLGTNTDHVFASDLAALDLSVAETNDSSAASAQWNLVALAEYPDVDYTASRLKYVVKCIEVQNADGSTGL